MFQKLKACSYVFKCICVCVCLWHTYMSEFYIVMIRNEVTEVVRHFLYRLKLYFIYRNDKSKIIPLHKSLKGNKNLLDK